MTIWQLKLPAPVAGGAGTHSGFCFPRPDDVTNREFLSLAVCVWVYALRACALHSAAKEATARAGCVGRGGQPGLLLGPETRLAFGKARSSSLPKPPGLQREPLSSIRPPPLPGTWDKLSALRCLTLTGKNIIILTRISPPPEMQRIGGEEEG